MPRLQPCGQSKQARLLSMPCSGFDVRLTAVRASLQAEMERRIVREPNEGAVGLVAKRKSRRSGPTATLVGCKHWARAEQRNTKLYTAQL